MYEYLKKQDKRIADETAGEENYFYLSPTRASLIRQLSPLAEKVIHGRCLDAGAGRMAYAALLRRYADDYIAMDIEWRPGLKAVGSAMAMPWRVETFDSVFCSQVLEHVPDPERAMSEFFRCLKPGGTIIVSAPHLSYLHNEPHDYFRYTKHGLRALLERAGFVEIETAAAGGLLSFLGHIPSVIAKTILRPIPLIGQAAMLANGWYSRFIAWVDERVETRKIYALNYIAAARKPGDAKHE